ncbi:hypothetical protein CK203_044081 [Vitis vinifera]|uniref:Uncharacterized protein n=1 Tax=Vitis vinifera TaxID=29760 RepID=A0A438HM78_VITVI|nr:hypothetical protein CK203_044081 [Vitis vinifera]
MCSAIREFCSFIDEFDVHPPLGGGAFTWCGRQEGSFKARLYYFLSSNNWEEHFSGEGFGDLIKEWWQKYEFRGSTSVALFNKMQALTKGPQEME